MRSPESNICYLLLVIRCYLFVVIYLLLFICYLFTVDKAGAGCGQITTTNQQSFLCGGASCTGVQRRRQSCRGAEAPPIVQGCRGAGERTINNQQSKNPYPTTTNHQPTTNNQRIPTQQPTTKESLPNNQQPKNPYPTTKESLPNNQRIPTQQPTTNNK
jgi:hypothetical protein